MKKKELSNLKILSECEASRKNIKREADRLIRVITNEIERLKTLGFKNILNETNKELLKRKIKILFRLRGDIIKGWVKLINDFNFDITNIMKREKIKSSIEEGRDILETIGIKEDEQNKI